MKNILFMSLSVIMVAGMVLSGCAPTEFQQYTDTFYNSVSEVLPAYPSASRDISSRALNSDWDWGNPIYEIYNILEDTTVSDAYVNIYEILSDADGYYNNMATGGTVIGDTTISCPVPLGLDSVNKVYDTYYKAEETGSTTQSFGRVDEDILYMLYTENLSSSAETSKKVLQGRYDEATGEITLGLFMANYVTESSVSWWETVWVYLTGDVDTHIFSIKMLRDNTGTAYKSNLVGYGVSQGSSDYFLFRMASETNDFATATYYHFGAIDPDASASSILTDLQSIDINGYSTAGGSGDASGYDSLLPDNYSASDFSSYDTDSELNSLSVIIDDTAF